MSVYMEPEYESPEDRVRRNARDAGGPRLPYASQAALEAMGTDLHTWSCQVQARLEEWVAGTNTALATAMKADREALEKLQAGAEKVRAQIGELRTWRAGFEVYLSQGMSALESRIAELESRLDRQDSDAAERRERS